MQELAITVSSRLLIDEESSNRASQRKILDAPIDCVFDRKHGFTHNAKPLRRAVAPYLKRARNLISKWPTPINYDNLLTTPLAQAIGAHLKRIAPDTPNQPANLALRSYVPFWSTKRLRCGLKSLGATVVYKHR